MAFQTIALGLTIKVPTRGTRAWAQTLLDECFKKLSEHDHTGSPKGLTIGAAALGTASVTTAKIASSAVTDAKLASTFCKSSLLFHCSTGSRSSGAGTSNCTAHGAAGGTKFEMPVAGVITHVSGLMFALIASGSDTVQIKKNGTAVDSTALTMDSSTTDKHVSHTLASPISFVAGDYIEVNVVGNTVIYTSGPTLVNLMLFGHFTA